LLFGHDAQRLGKRPFFHRYETVFDGENRPNYCLIFEQPAEWLEAAAGPMAAGGLAVGPGRYGRVPPNPSANDTVPHSLPARQGTPQTSQTVVAAEDRQAIEQAEPHRFARHGHAQGVNDLSDLNPFRLDEVMQPFLQGRSVERLHDRQLVLE